MHKTYADSGSQSMLHSFFSVIENVDHIFAPQEVKRQPFNRAKKSASVLPSHVPNVLECDN